MTQPIFKINNVDYTKYVSKLTISSNDIDASDSGRSKAGTMRRRRIATKMKLQIELRPVNHTDIVTLSTALSPQTISVTYIDPRYASARTATFYGSTISFGEQTYGGEDVQWNTSTFSLIEV